MPLYPPRDAALSDYRRDLRTLPTRLLLEQQEAYGWQLAELTTEAGVAWREESIAFVRFKHRQIQRELDRRQEVKSKTPTPVWPTAAPDTHEYWAAVKAAVDLQDLIERRVPNVQWRRSGDELVMRCPFGIHEDKTPSFYLKPSEHIFKCFGCGIGGDCFTWVMAYDGCPFLVAVDALAAEAGVSPPPPIAPPVTASRRQSKKVRIKHVDGTTTRGRPAP
jgi:hypothetical protein